MESLAKKDIIFFIKEWCGLLVAFIVIVTYIVISALPKQNNYLGETWQAILFTVLNLTATFYIAKKVSLWGWQTDNAASQKKIAKTAIRHNRANLTSIVKLIKITSEKIGLVQEPLTSQYLKEIRNHLEMIYNGIKNSEADFNEIVNEELREQNILELEITELIEEKDNANKKIIELEGGAAQDSKLIDELRENIKKKDAEISKKVNALPFGITSGSLNIDTDSLVNFTPTGTLFSEPIYNILGSKNSYLSTESPFTSGTQSVDRDVPLGSNLSTKIQENDAKNQS